MHFIDSEESEQGYLHKELTDSVIKVFYKVYKTLGFGFVENVYQNAMINFLFILKEYAIQMKMKNLIMD